MTSPELAKTLPPNQEAFAALEGSGLQHLWEGSNSTPNKCLPPALRGTPSLGLQLLSASPCVYLIHLFSIKFWPRWNVHPMT